MDSERGARDRPACMALYSRVICRKSGRTIMAPPRVICCSVCWEMPMRKFRCLNRSDIEQGGLAAPLPADEPEGERDQGHRADTYEQADIFAALLPDEDAEDDAAHANH